MLLIEKETLTRNQFFQAMKFEHNDYFKIPPELSLEDFPMSFHFYNCMIPLIKNCNQECFYTYLCDCDAFTEKNAYNEFLKMTNEPEGRANWAKLSEKVKKIPSSLALAQSNPQMIEESKGFGSLDSSFMPSKTFRFLHKPYGLPQTYTGKLPSS